MKQDLGVLEELCHVDMAPKYVRLLGECHSVIQQVLARAADEIKRLREQLENQGE